MVSQLAIRVFQYHLLVLSLWQLGLQGGVPGLLAPLSLLRLRQLSLNILQLASHRVISCFKRPSFVISLHQLGLHGGALWLSAPLDLVERC